MLKRSLYNGVCTCMCVSMYVCVCTCMCVSMYVCTVHISVCVYFRLLCICWREECIISTEGMFTCMYGTVQISLCVYFRLLCVLYIILWLHVYMYGMDVHTGLHTYEMCVCLQTRMYVYTHACMYVRNAYSACMCFYVRHPEVSAPLYTYIHTYA